MTNPISVTTITVRTGRLECIVRVPDEKYRSTNPRLAAFVQNMYPDLPHHACVNPVGNTFGDVIERTSTPHLLEHLTISLQVRNAGANDALFVGTTEWLDEEAGIARIALGFTDDLVALHAFNEAVKFLNIAVLTCLA